MSLVKHTGQSTANLPNLAKGYKTNWVNFE